MLKGEQLLAWARRRKAILWGGLLLTIAVSVLIVVCASAFSRQAVLRLATTTSVENSGLLDAILPDFESSRNIKVDVIAVGTGQALALGELGDVDVVLVHAPALEEEFVGAGYGVARFGLMYNDFVLAGPARDPAGVAEATRAVDALLRIAEAEEDFASRGDNSGTHFIEMNLWREAGFEPTESQDWYLSVGQGMGATLNFANEQGAYVLTDRGTFLAQRSNLPNLVVLFGGESAAENPDPALRNYYSVIPVNPELHSQVDFDLAMEFVDWLTSIPTQATIAEFGVEEFGMPLFYPDSEAWRARP